MYQCYAVIVTHLVYIERKNQTWLFSKDYQNILWKTTKDVLEDSVTIFQFF